MPYMGYILMGLVAGFASKLLGIGGGVIAVPVLLFFFALPMDKAIGTSLAFIFPVAFVGATRDAYKGFVDYRIALIAIPFGIVGVFLGGWAESRIETRTLKVIFGILMIVVGLKMVALPGGWGELVGKVRGVPAETPDQELERPSQGNSD